MLQQASEHASSIQRITRELEQGQFLQRNERYIRFLEGERLDDEREEAERRRLVTKVALSGVMNHSAHPLEQRAYTGKIQGPRKVKFMRIRRTPHSLCVHTSPKCIRLHTTFNARGRIQAMVCTMLERTEEQTKEIGSYKMVSIEYATTEPQWESKRIKIGELEHTAQIASAFNVQGDPSHYKIEITRLLIERSHQLIRQLADTLWYDTPFPPYTLPLKASPIESIAQDMVACERIGRVARAVPTIEIIDENTLNITYRPEACTTLFTAGWAKPIKKI